jgi:hypothetical protein
LRLPIFEPVNGGLTVDDSGQLYDETLVSRGPG